MLVWRCRVPGDKTVKVWDIRERMPRATIVAHDHEILTLDWNKYNEFVFASGAADCRVRQVRLSDRQMSSEDEDGGEDVHLQALQVESVSSLLLLSLSLLCCYAGAAAVEVVAVLVAAADL